MTPTNQAPKRLRRAARRKLVVPPEPRRCPTWNPPQEPWPVVVDRVLARLAADRARRRR